MRVIQVKTGGLFFFLSKMPVLLFSTNNIHCTSYMM